MPTDWQFRVLVFNRDFPEIVSERVTDYIQISPLSETRKGLRYLPHYDSTKNYDVLFTANECIVGRIQRPRVTVCHDINELMWEAQRQSIWSPRTFVNRIQQQVRIRSICRCSLIACNSEFVRKEIIERYGVQQETTRLAFCGVDDLFYTNESNSDCDRKTLLEKSARYVLTFATGDPRENYWLLPDILETIRRRHPDVRMVVAGIFENRPYTAILRKAFADHNLTEGQDFEFVRFIGERNIRELVELYRGASVYLELSGHEGFGMQLAEAMACGIRCVATPFGALSEIGGEFVSYVRDLKATTIAETVCNELDEIKPHTRRRAQIEFTRRYSWAESARVIGKAIEDAVAG
jgi:glycosyltransferase involved in cell wall biosynthesis